MPQWAGSLRVSTQLPAHAVKPAGHAHALAMHDAPSAHAFPHVPQCRASVAVFAHVPAQFTAGGAHEVQPPPVQL